MSSTAPGRPQLFSTLLLADTWPLWLTLGLFQLALTLLFTLSQHQRPPGEPSLMLVMQTLLAVAAPAVGLASLARVRRVMDGALMPRAGLLRSARGLAWALWAWWMLLSLPSLLLSMLLGPGPLTPGQLLAAPAWLALAMGLSALASLSWGGLLPRRWLLLPLAVWALPFWLGATPLWAAWQPAWPLQLACLLMLPLLLQGLVRRRPAARLPRPGVPQRFKRLLRSLASRQALLEQSNRGLGRYLWVDGLILLSFSSNPQWPSWGDSQGAGSVLRLLLMTLLALRLLQSRDLHWRALLAPQGALRRQLGLRIWRDSLRGITLLLALVVLPLLLVGALLSGWPDPLRWLGIALPFGLELVLATGLAVLARGLCGSTTRAATAVLLIALLWLPMLWFAPAWMSWTRGPTQMLVLLGACLMLLPLQRRAWQRVELGQLVERAHRETDAEAQG